MDAFADGALGRNYRAIHSPLFERILADKPHPEMGYRGCLGIIRLAAHYSVERMEAAAERALLPSGVPRPRRGTRSAGLYDSVRVWLFGAIDHQKFDWTSCRFQAQSQLLLESRENRGCIGGDRWIGIRTDSAPLAGVVCIRQCEVVPAGQPGFVDDLAIEQPGEESGQLRQSGCCSGDLAPAHLLPGGLVDGRVFQSRSTSGRHKLVNPAPASSHYGRQA